MMIMLIIIFNMRMMLMLNMVVVELMMILTMSMMAFVGISETQRLHVQRYIEGEMHRLKLPFRSLMPKWMSKNNLKEELTATTTKLGIEIKHGAAFLYPMQVVIKRVIELVAKDLLKLYPGMTLRV